MYVCIMYYPAGRRRKTVDSDDNLKLELDYKNRSDTRLWANNLTFRGVGTTAATQSDTF